MCCVLCLAEQSTSLDTCLVVSEPLGLVLIVGSWCSPVQLCLVPLVGAVAAGDSQVFSRKSWIAVIFLHHILMFRFRFHRELCHHQPF